jgi:hypothetical protein
MNWIYLAQCRCKWQIIVNSYEILILLVPSTSFYDINNTRNEFHALEYVFYDVN